MSSQFKKKHLPFCGGLASFLHFPSHPPQTTIPHLGWHEAGTAPTRWYLSKSCGKTVENTNEPRETQTKNIGFVSKPSSFFEEWKTHCQSTEIFGGGICKFYSSAPNSHLLLQPCQRCCATRYRHRKTVLHGVPRICRLPQTKNQWVDPSQSVCHLLSY